MIKSPRELNAYNNLGPKFKILIKFRLEDQIRKLLRKKKKEKKPKLTVLPIVTVVLGTILKRQIKSFSRK